MVEPAGRRCGCWVTSPFLFREFFFADSSSGRTMERGRSAIGANDGDVGGSGGDGAMVTAPGELSEVQPATGSSNKDRKICSTDSQGARKPYWHAFPARACEGGAERRVPPADRPARAGWAALRQFLFRDFPSDVGWRVPPLYPLTRAHEVDSATRWGRHKAAAGQFHFREIRFGAAAIAASVSGATRSGPLGGAAAAGRHRGDDGARALVANAADDDVAARAAPASHGVIANRRH